MIKRYLSIMVFLLCFMLVLSCTSCSKKVNVVFQTNDDEKIEYEIKSGTKIKPLFTQTKGCYLEGWYCNEELTDKFDFNREVTESITLYPKFEKIAYQITINTNYKELNPYTSDTTIALLDFVFYVKYGDVFNLSEMYEQKFGNSMDIIFQNGSVRLNEVKYKDKVIFSKEEEWMSDYLFEYTENIVLDFYYEDKIDEINKTENDYLINLLTNDKSLIKTENGLVYKILEHGEGSMPTDITDVKVNYSLSNIKGKIIDKQDEVVFNPTRVVPGFSEMLKLMHVGDKAICYIPYRLGYGDRYVNNDLPAYSLLIFEITLLEVIE